ncbi:hypothetical protein ACFQNE_02970 [Gordonia phosphorivorans]|uniref:DUF222 domain-containing protein n=1 Tax=Gordonia phosphorivorans TaxID=1056982 RepID=A0ABV6H3Z2_9ACTN
MTSISEADAAIDAELDGLELVSAGAAPVGDIVDAADTPCTADEARALIRRAVNAANDFYSAIAELLSRQGHAALGYDSPRQMISQELSGMLVNPRTGKPVSDTHLRRMTRVAWLAWSIAQNTGVDMSELKISERAVRSISAAAAGLDDVDLIDDITARMAEIGPDGPDEVNDIINGALTSYNERREQDVDNDPDLDDGSGEGGEQAAAGRRPAGGGGGDGAGFHADAGGAGGVETEPDSDGHGDGEAAAPADAQPAAPRPAASLTEIFDTGLPDGVEASVSDSEVYSVLSHMRTAADVRRVLADITRIHALLPEITKIRKQVPHIIDAIDDDELAAIETELRSTDSAVEWAAEARQVISDGLEEVQIRLDEAI